MKPFLFAAAAATMLAFVPAGPGGNGIDIASIDKSVSPREDFYQYANGNWLRNNPVPADQPRWGSFDVLQEQNNAKILDLVKEASADNGAKSGSPRQMLRDFYNTAMDTVTIEKQGLSVLKPELEKLAALTNKSQLGAELAHLHMQGAGGLFSFYVYRDLKNSSMNICYATQGGLGLPDRDYYFKTDEKFVKIREEYMKHITNMLNMSGYKGAAEAAPKILAFETELAKVSMSRVDLRDEEKTYHKMDFAGLQALAPSFDWKSFMATGNMGTQYPICVGQPEFFKRMNQLIDSMPLSDLQAYLHWNIIRSSAGMLSSEFVNEAFNFNGRILNGTQQMRPRWKRVLGACDASIGEAVGQLYVEKYFSQNSKMRVKKMVDNLLAAYKVRIENLDWMSPETKKRALEKLSQFNTKLGYPDKWKDYSKLSITTDSYLMNVVRSNNFDWDDMVSKLGKPVDKTEWQMLPHQVNAYYEPTLNEIVFPAAIMQPPFFYADADDAVNYGAIGAVIGHEVTHGFDDQGSKYDGTGNLHDWWTSDDRDKFNARAKKLIDQFNAYEALPGLHVNGELTIGENIADLGGLSTSFDAYKMSLADKKGHEIDGLTAEQRFYLAFAQVWRGNFKEEYLRKMVMTNPHSPGNFRAYTVTNFPSFYDAFGVKPGDKMYRGDDTRCKIW